MFLNFSLLSPLLPCLLSYSHNNLNFKSSFTIKTIHTNTLLMVVVADTAPPSGAKIERCDVPESA